MKDPTEQHLDNLSKRVLGNSELESPSVNFVSDVMSQIELLGDKKIRYAPVISKRGWLITALAALSIAAYTIFGGVESLGWLEGMDMRVLENNRISQMISGITVSKPVLYSVVLFGVLMVIQIFVLKNYFDKRIQF